MMELSKLQKQIIESNAEQVVVIASAACGKTRTLTERVRFWLN
jgi:superfamily I DNA/RNA helicase